MSESCVICGRPSVHTHHRKLRSQGGDNSPENLMRLCISHHNYIHANPKDSYEHGWMVKSWDDPATVPVLTEGEQVEEVGTTDDPESRTVPGQTILDSVAPAFMSDSDGNATSPPPSVSPGEKCPACARRIPLPKKETSPTTKVFSVRIPLDDLEAWEEALDAASEHLGIGTKAAHHRFKTLNAGLALCLQAPKGILNEG